MTVDQVVTDAKAAVARAAERRKEQPGENFAAWVEVPAAVFAAVVKDARDTPATKEILKAWRDSEAKLPGVNKTVLAEQFLAVVGKAQPAPAEA